MRSVLPWLRRTVDTRRERRLWLLGTFVGAIVFRAVLFVSGLVDVVFETADSYEYQWLAESLLKHGVFGFEGVPKMNRTPGFPTFLAAVYATVGRSQAAVTAVQVTLDALVCVMVVDLLLRARVSRAGVGVAALLATTCVFTATYSFEIMTETFYTFVLVLAMWLLPRRGLTGLLRKAARPRLAAFGLLLGIATLVRPAFAVSVAMFGLFAAVGLGRILRRRVLRPRVIVAGAIFAASTAAVVVPWMVRNRVVFAAEYEKPDHSHVTLLGYKTDIPTYRHYYSPQFMAFRKSYEEPFIMERPEQPPVIARYVFADEREMVVAAFAKLAAEIKASDVTPISVETLGLFEGIARRRMQTAPRLYLTAPLSRAAKFWVVPRVSVLLKGKHGGNTPLALTVALTLYNCLYVLPGLLGLLMRIRRIRAARLYAISVIVGHTALHSLWHPEVQSRYAVPLFPLLCIGCAVVAHQLVQRGFSFSAWMPQFARWRAKSNPS